MIFRSKTYRSTVGGIGEQAAAELLQKKRYKILERNYRVGRNEIDLIAEQDGFIVFVEVKTRTASPDVPSPWGMPARAVTAKKRRGLILAAQSYVHRGKPGYRFRFDVVEVYLREDRTVCAVHHMENAFTG